MLDHMIVLFLFFFLLKFYLFIYGCAGSSLLQAGLLSLWREGATLQLQCTEVSPVMEHGFWAQGLSSRSSQTAAQTHSCGCGAGCSEVCGLFPGQGSNLCPLHWQVDSSPVHHQGSPIFSFLRNLYTVFLAGTPIYILTNCVGLLFIDFLMMTILTGIK